MRSATTVVMLSMLILGAVGCAKTPAMLAASAPAPAGVATAPRSGGPGASTPSSPRAMVPPAGAAARTDGRPSAKDFTALADVLDVHFDFDRYDIRPNAVPVVDANARLLRARGADEILIEGHCDERGTSEYNLALGERRATAARNALVARGVDVRRITIVSYGEDRPQCRDRTEACRAKNRRARFLVKGR
jgi:peptidoglycan-associated lipoprotein